MNKSAWTALVCFLAISFGWVTWKVQYVPLRAEDEISWPKGSVPQNEFLLAIIERNHLQAQLVAIGSSHQHPVPLGVSAQAFMGFATKDKTLAIEFSDGRGTACSFVTYQESGQNARRKTIEDCKSPAPTFGGFVFLRSVRSTGKVFLERVDDQSWEVSRVQEAPPGARCVATDGTSIYCVAFTRGQSQVYAYEGRKWKARLSLQGAPADISSDFGKVLVRTSHGLAQSIYKWDGKSSTATELKQHFQLRGQTPGSSKYDYYAWTALNGEDVVLAVWGADLKELWRSRDRILALRAIVPKRLTRTTGNVLTVHESRR